MFKLKRSAYFLIAVVLIKIILFPSMMAFANSSKELLINGDFEEDNSWENWGGFSYTSDKQNVISGKRAGIVAKSDGGSGNIVNNIKPKTMYKLSGYAKVDGIGQECILGAECLDSDGKKIQGGRFIISFNTGTFEKKSRTFYTVPGTAQIQVYLYVINIVDRGMAYYDNISLTKIEPEDYVNKNNGAFLPEDWFNKYQSTENIQNYVSDLKEKGIKYQFVDIGLLNSDGSMNSQNYKFLGQWIKNSKETDPEQCIIGILNYNQRYHIDSNGTKILNPDFGTELFKNNINSLVNNLVNIGTDVNGVRYRLDGISIDFEPFVVDDERLLDCLKYLRQNSLSENKYLSISGPIDYSLNKTWSNAYISNVASVVNQINPMLYDLMGYDSCVNNSESYESICKSELRRFNDAIKNSQSNNNLCKLFPLIPSYELRIEKSNLVVYHDPQVENVLPALNAIKDVNRNGVDISGVGIFWWPTFMGYYPNLYKPNYYLIDQNNWMKFWVINES